jgi:hypothetical protein
MEVTLSGAAPDGQRRAVIACSFDGARASASIASSALSAIAPGSASVTIAARSEARVQAGDYVVVLQADTHALTPDGRRIAGLALLK